VSCYLVVNAADVDDVTSNSGPHFAQRQRGDLQVVKLLVKAGADPNAVNEVCLYSTSCRTYSIGWRMRRKLTNAGAWMLR
jgi:hypothetical protein